MGENLERDHKICAFSLFNTEYKVFEGGHQSWPFSLCKCEKVRLVGLAQVDWQLSVIFALRIQPVSCLSGAWAQSPTVSVRAQSSHGHSRRLETEPKPLGDE